jgi:hypothetical protein
MQVSLFSRRGDDDSEYSFSTKLNTWSKGNGSYH